MKRLHLILVLLLVTVSSYSQLLFRHGTLGGVSTLYTGLVAAWGLNEASGTIYDYTNNNYDGTAYNTPTYGATGKVDDAISFAEGSSEYLGFGTSFWDPGTSDITIAAWFAVISSNDQQGIVGNWGTYPYWYIMVGTSDYVYCVANFADVNIQTISNGTVLTDGTFYHVFYELDRSGNTSLYINNVLQNDQDDISSHSAVNLANSNEHAIARIGDDLVNYYMDGTIDAVQVWSRLLTSDERAEVYNSGNGWEP